MVVVLVGTHPSPVIHLLCLAHYAIIYVKVRDRKPPSQTWRTFPADHPGQVAAINCFTVPTVALRAMYVFLVFRQEH